ncbi:hypothetical protein SGLAM104S_02538 [Streptomyces glaucescens]
MISYRVQASVVPVVSIAPVSRVIASSCNCCRVSGSSALRRVLNRPSASSAARAAAACGQPAAAASAATPGCGAERWSMAWSISARSRATRRAWARFAGSGSRVIQEGRTVWRMVPFMMAGIRAVNSVRRCGGRSVPNRASRKAARVMSFMSA